MKIYSYKDLTKQEVEEICLRQLEDDVNIQERVKSIVERVKMEGDKALFDYALSFDQIRLEELFIDQQEILVCCCCPSSPAAFATVRPPLVLIMITPFAARAP